MFCSLSESLALDHWPHGGESTCTASAKQLAAGCTVPDDWNQITPSGGTPPGSYFPQMVYDTLTKNVIQYGGVCNSNTSVGCNQTWAYNIPTKTWTQKALGTTPPPVYLGSQSVAGGTDEGSTTYNPVTHKVIYHQLTNTGAPADWQYDPAADTSGPADLSKWRSQPYGELHRLRRQHQFAYRLDLQP